VNLTGAQLAKADLYEADLSQVNLSGADLSGADLCSSDLSHANLSGADLTNAHLAYANLHKTDLSQANLNGADALYTDLTYADLTAADLTKAYLSKVNLTEAVLTGANLCLANLNAAQLKNTDFTNAIFNSTRITSKKALLEISGKLGDDQLSGIVFTDEKDYAKKPHEGIKDATQYLLIKINTAVITPFNLSYLLLAIEGAYNNLYFLATTEKQNVEIIKSSITPYYQGVKLDDSITIRKIKEGSIILEMVAPLTAATGVLYVLAKIFQIISSEIREHRIANQEVESKRLDNLNKALVELPKSINNFTEHEKRVIELISGKTDFSKIIESFPVKSKTVEENKEQLTEIACQPIVKILYKYHHLGTEIETKYIDNSNDGGI